MGAAGEVAGCLLDGGVGITLPPALGSGAFAQAQAWRDKAALVGFPASPQDQKFPGADLKPSCKEGLERGLPSSCRPRHPCPPPPPPVEGLRLIAPEIHTRRENIRKSEQVEGVTYSPSLPRQPHALARAQFTPGLAVTSSARRRGHPACRDGCGELGKSLAFQLERLSWDFRPCHPCHDLAHL